MGLPFYVTYDAVGGDAKQGIRLLAGCDPCSQGAVRQLSEMSMASTIEAIWSHAGFRSARKCRWKRWFWQEEASRERTFEHEKTPQKSDRDAVLLLCAFPFLISFLQNPSSTTLVPPMRAGRRKGGLIDPPLSNGRSSSSRKVPIRVLTLHG